MNKNSKVYNYAVDESIINDVLYGCSVNPAYVCSRKMCCMEQYPKS